VNWSLGPATTLAVCVLLSGLPTSTLLAQSAGTASSPVSLYGVVPGDPAAIAGNGSTQQVEPAAVDAAQTAKRTEFVVAPMPMVNPTLENGLSVVAGVLYRIDPDDRTTAPSVTGAGGFKTSNGSWAAAAVQSLHLGHDRFRLLGIVAYSDINYDFFGIGESAGGDGVSIELNQFGTVGVFDGLWRIAPNWYVGARYQLLKMTVGTDGITLPDGPTLPPLDANVRTASLGPRVDFDTRDNPFYPRRGTQIRGIVNLYGKDVGGQRSYQAYEGWINRYHALGARNVLAWHAGACETHGSVPFYDLCLLGKSQDLRGYTVGQYRDRSMVAAQAEWRSELWWRFGAAAFFGTGEVKPDFESFTWNDLLPGGGVGARFTLADRNHVNLRVDYAWGKNSSALYIGVLEAF